MHAGDVDGKIPSVQALRAFAALAVVLQHLLNEGRAGAPYLFGLFGVHVFFVISGFVMVYASRSLFGRPGAPRIFLARRIARIVPLYWLATTGFVLVALAAPAVVDNQAARPAYVLASYVFIPWPRPDGLIQPVYSLGWTLNYEMLFYVLFATLILLPCRRAVAGVAAVLAAGVIAGKLMGFTEPVLVFWTDPIVLGFALGMGVALLRRAGVILAPALRAAIALATLLLLAGGPFPALRFELAAAGLVAAAVLGPDRLPATRLGAGLVLLGEASYALYLVHPFAIRALHLAWHRAHLAGPLTDAVLFAASLAAAIAAAILVHLWIERPLTRAANALLGGRPVLRLAAG